MRREELDREAFKCVRARDVVGYRELACGLADADPTDAHAQFHCGVALSLVSDGRDESLARIMASIDMDPTDAEHLAVGASLMFDAGELELAQDYVTRTGELATLSEFKLGSELVHTAGRLAAARGDMTRARSLFEGAFESETENAKFAKDLIRVLLAIGDTRAAHEVIGRSLASNPTDPELLALSSGTT